MKLPPQQQDDAICNKLLEVGLTITPQEQLERVQARFDHQIRQKIEWITFLKTTKTKIFDSPGPDPAAVRRPRGPYRESWKRPQEKPTAKVSGN
jgi:hypothetical protein